jgi:MGT family glycosyltransferase
MAAKAPVYLARGAPEFDYHRRDLPPNVHYVGPLESRGTALDQIPRWLEELTGETPVVYVSEGTMRFGEPVILRSALRGLADLDVRVVMTSGPRGYDDLAIGKVPSNFQVERWIPEWHLLPRVSVVVTVGGAGTVMGALAAGVPLLVIPQETDQPDNARRVIECGAGLAMPRRKCSPRTLRDAVLRLLREPSFRLNAARIRKVFSKYDSREQAVSLIESLIGKEERQNEVRNCVGVGEIPL